MHKNGDSMFLRIKNLRSSNGTMIPYAYLCENTWIKEKKQARQKVVLYIGKVNDLEILDLKKINLIECSKCGTKENLVPDHIIPLTHGGTNNAENIQCLCAKCNRQKGYMIEGVAQKIA